MPFNPHPTGFRTKHWRSLYESYILDLSSLKKAVNAGATFVLIDAEPWGADSSKPAEIGISLLPSLDHVQIDTKGGSRTMAWTLDDISSRYHIETHWIRVLGRERQEKHRQPHRFGQQHELADDQVEEAISDIIHQFTQQYHSQTQQTPLILAGFSLYFEFSILSGFYPKLLRFFASWLDLQEVAGQVAIKDSRLILPSLRQTLLACGFEDVASQSMKSLHNAATDTTQAAALLIRLLRLGEDEKLEIKQSSHKAHPRTYRKNPLEKRIWKKKPTPKELFPYAAKVSRNTGFAMFKTAEPLLGLFADYQPVAVGLSGDKKHGWVCLPDLKALEEFVHHVNLSTLKGDNGDKWVAVSAYDAAIVPAKDMSELRLSQQANLHALAVEKRLQRSRKSMETNLAEQLENVTNQPSQ